MTTQSRLLRCADRIATRLVRDAVWHDGRCSWLGWHPSLRKTYGPYGGLEYRAIGTSLYDGTAGVGLFLAHVAALTRDELMLSTAIGALMHAQSEFDTMVIGENLGFYAGACGIAYVFCKAARVLGEERFAITARAMVATIAACEPPEGRLDIVDGSAGIIPFLLTFADAAQEAPIEAAIAHGERLVRTAQTCSNGSSWRRPNMASTANLVGYSHGVCGIACALVDLYEATGCEEFATTARAAIAYERGTFVEPEGNWPDFRLDVSGNRATANMIAWCHGATGVGIGRLRIAQSSLVDDHVNDEIEAALATTIQSLDDRNPSDLSFCHGEFGKLEFLLSASEQLGRPELARIVDTYVLGAIERYEEKSNPWPCGRPIDYERPGMMRGVSGIGYFLLRMLGPCSTPSILTFEKVSIGKARAAEGR